MDIISRIFKTLPLILLLSCGVLSNTHAFPLIDHDHSQSTIISFAGNSAYDADADVYTARLRADGGTVPDVGVVDFSGYLDLSVMVDEMGTVFGGAVSWFGGSVALGIPDDTLLFSGTVADFGYGINQGAPQFHAIFDVDYSVDPLGFGLQAGLILFQYPFDADLPPSEWLKTSFESHSYTGDELVSISVPEPATMLLFGTGMFWILLLSAWTNKRCR